MEKTQKQVQTSKNIEINNNVIIDLKVKVSKVDYFLTTFLDYNNTINKDVDKLLLSPDEHSNISDTVMALIDTLFLKCKRLYDKDNEVKDENKQKQ